MSEEAASGTKLILEKLDKIIELLEARAPTAGRTRQSKVKPEPLLDEEIRRHQQKFNELFEVWEKGDELGVQRELEAMDADQIRRFADANNLNVTAKMAKEKVLKLISGRFRERRQLTRSHFRRDNS